MTAVPVVSTPLNTRTVRERCPDCRADGRAYLDGTSQLVDRCPTCEGWGVRKRLVADPAFVVLPEVSDLTCRECKGEGAFQPHEGYGGPCESCGCSGVSPVYAATWQALDDDGDWYTPGRPLTKQDVERFPNDCRQLVEWRARRVEPLPVVMVGPYTPDGPAVEVMQSGRAWFVMVKNGRTAEVFGQCPIKQSLRPDMCVLRLSDWEHLEQPHTEAVCPECGGHGSLTCCAGYGRLPLSVPDGVLSWIELTR